MTLKRTHYEILGLPRTATREQIKKRYRQLVRKYHPDVAEDKAVARTAFLQISEAYKTLVDPDRRLIYDAELDLQIAGQAPGTARSTTTSAGSRSSSGFHVRQPSSRQRTSQRGSRSAERSMQEAREAMARGQLWVAMDCARDAVNADHRNVQAHILLGDIYRMQNRNDEAVAEYSVALQLDPANTEAKTKLDRASRHSRRGFTDATAERMQALKTGITLISAAVGAFVLLMLAISPGQPIPWLREHLPFVGTWSPMLIFTLLAAGSLTGLLMSVTDNVRALDDELVFQAVSAGRRVSYPIGLILVLLNIFAFYAAAGIYIVAALVQDSVSASVIKSFVATVCVLVLVGLIYPPGTREVLVWGGNLVFPALLFGWAVGDFIKPWS